MHMWILTKFNVKGIIIRSEPEKGNERRTNKEVENHDFTTKLSFYSIKAYAPGNHYGFVTSQHKEILVAESEFQPAGILSMLT